MPDVFLGTTALAGGRLTRAKLRWNYKSIFPDVYVPRAAPPTLRLATVGAWLWSGRNGVIAGRAAAALHGALWVDAATPIEMVANKGKGRTPQGIVVRNERIHAAEIVEVDGMPVRLLLIDAGLPAPRTQIKITDGFNEAFIDMGYDEPKVGLDYDGQRHSSDRERYVHDIGRAELIDREGWIDIHVVAEHSRRFILHRVSEAFARRGCPLKLRSAS